MLVTATTKIEPEVKDQWIQWCKDHDMTLSQGLRAAMKQYIKNYKEEE